jgi:hypothetical protein
MSIQLYGFTVKFIVAAIEETEAVNTTLQLSIYLVLQVVG